MSENTAATAGRGFLVITAAKLWFMVGGAAITFGLPYIFGSSLYGDSSDGRALYGQYVDINNTLSIFSMVMITGVMQSVAKFVAERPDQSGGIMRQAWMLMLGLGLLVGGGFVLAAPWIAEARNNPELVNGYRAAGVILFSYALYTVFIGTLNGRKLFFRQALYDIGFTTIKFTLVIGLALAGLGVVGAFSGFALAAFIIMIVATWRVGREKGPGEPEPRLYAFAAQVMLYTLVFNFMFKLDVLMFKPYAFELFAPAAEWMPNSGLFEGARERAVAASADGLLGLYGIALSVARLPWQITIAITFIIFPMVSEATFANDHERTRLYIRQTMRYSMLLIGGASVVLAAVPQAIIGLLPATFADAAIALAWLAPAYFCFALFNVINTLLMSSGKATAALFIGIITASVAALLYWLILPGATGTESLLIRAGVCTFGAFSVGLIAGVGVIWKNYGAPIPWGTAARVVGLGVALAAVGRFLPPTGKVVSLGIAVAIGLAFLVGLILLREFGAEDKARLMRIIKRGT